jgi:hypothetical protein
MDRSLLSVIVQHGMAKNKGWCGKMIGSIGVSMDARSPVMLRCWA